jgi:hypothetical protein
MSQELTITELEARLEQTAAVVEAKSVANA